MESRHQPSKPLAVESPREAPPPKFVPPPISVPQKKPPSFAASVQPAVAPPPPYMGGSSANVVAQQRRPVIQNIVPPSSGPTYTRPSFAPPKAANVVQGRPASTSFSNPTFSNLTASRPSPSQPSRPRSRSRPSSSFSSTSFSSPQKDAIMQCVGMGFDETMSRNALEATGWDVQSAIALLLNEGGMSGAPSSGSSASLPQPVTQSSGSGKKKLRFKIPPNVSPGQTVTISDPSGKKYAVKVPAHAKPGSTLQIYV